MTRVAAMVLLLGTATACPHRTSAPEPSPQVSVAEPQRVQRDKVLLDLSARLSGNPSQRNYGVAVSDLDGDGRMSFIVAGHGHANLVYGYRQGRWQREDVGAIGDPEREAIGVAACDIDGDGLEELYVLNTDRFAGKKRFADRLFDRDARGRWRDLFEDERNTKALNLTAGRSVACVDRQGDGRYGVFVANYGGPMRLYELDAKGALVDRATSLGLGRTTGGRGVLAAPLLSEAGMDIVAVNEHGPNFVFDHRGPEGHYSEVAKRLGLLDPHEHGRGLTVLDANQDGRLDLAYGNWEGPHRLMLQQSDGRFIDRAPEAMAEPSTIRTVIAADLDNDGFEELFFHNIGQANRLFRQREVGGPWEEVALEEAREPKGLGTGAAVADLDGNGRLELLLAHGESGPQGLTLFEAPPSDHNWLRIMPKTKQGAPARGARVEVRAGARRWLRVIDAGSGYLCQMEPVAHVGLGALEAIDEVEVVWPDGARENVKKPAIGRLLVVAHP